MTKQFIFDVDGTVTPSRDIINQQFAVWFKDFASNSQCYFVTGSDRNKTIEQLTKPIYNLAVRVYQCSGNDVWQQDKNIYSGIVNLPEAIKQELEGWLTRSKFKCRSGNHIEERPGLVNFSIVGRNATMEQRYLYRGWDDHKSERKMISEDMKGKFPDWNFQVAGETGIDITPVGCDKSQILKDFDLVNDDIYFFGDKTSQGGNDYEIAYELASAGHKIYQVNGWEHTWNILKKL